LKPRPSRVPEYRVPDIAAGMGERPKPARKAEPLVKTAKPKSAPRNIAAAPAASKAAPAKPTATACAPDEQRLRNYAARMVEDLGIGPTDDLKLFAPDGMPSPNLASVMLAMSAVELGMLRASPDLVEEAVRRMGGKAAESGASKLAIP
jgi:hypothetical protein